MTEEGGVVIDEEGAPIAKYKGKIHKRNIITHQKLWEKYTKDLPNVTQLKGHCPQEIVYPNNDIDILFVDATHCNPNDWDIIEAHLPKLNPNAMICGHDYKTFWPDVVANVERLEKKFNTKVTLYPDTTLWMIRT